MRMFSKIDKALQKASNLKTQILIFAFFQSCVNLYDYRLLKTQDDFIEQKTEKEFDDYLDQIVVFFKTIYF